MKKSYLIACLFVLTCVLLYGAAMSKETFYSKQTIVREEKRLPYLEAADTVVPEALSEETSLTGWIDDTGITKNAEVYLSVYFDINIDEDSFYDALHKIVPKQQSKEEDTESEDSTSEVETSEEAASDEELSEEAVSEEELSFSNTGADMIKAAIICAGKENLAATYSEEKIEERLQFYGIHDTPDKSYSSYDSYPYIVCALDLGLIEEKTAQNAIASTLTREEQLKLLMNVTDLTGNGRNYIGYSGDTDIYTKLRYIYQIYDSFETAELADIKNGLLAEEITENCVLKKKKYDAKFLPELTLWYTHTSLKHIEEITGLLNSENIAAKIQLEPKTIFTREADGEPSSTLAFDLVLEFEKKADMESFCLLAEDYGKINDNFSGLTDSYAGSYYYTGEAAGLDSRKLSAIEEFRVDGETESLFLYAPDEESGDLLESRLKELLGISEDSLNHSFLQKNSIFVSHDWYLAIGGTESALNETESQEEPELQKETETETETETEESKE